jgi:hypothetical protein
MKNDHDVVFGFLTSAITFIVSHFNAIIGGCIGVISLGIMLLRLRREWKHRNDPPES